MGAAGLTGSGLADKGGRVTGGFDSGRFGDTPAAEKGGRVTGAQTASARSASPDPGRFDSSVAAEKGGRVGAPSTTGSIARGASASVGRQSSVNGQYNNGGINAGQVTGKPAVGNGLAAGISPPSVSARAAETKSMAELNRPSSPNYGVKTAAKAREAEDASIAKHGAWQGALSTIKSVEAQRAKNPATGAVDPYNGLVGARRGARTPTHADLTGMTIAEVRDYQRGMVSRGHASSAVGAYQMIGSTLGEAVKRTGLSPDTKFTKSTQDLLAQDLVSNRARQATRNGDLKPENLADQLANEWAGLASSTGRSAHHGVNGNRSGNTFSGTLAAANALSNTGAVGPGAVKGSRVTAPARAAEASSTTVAAPSARPSPDRFAERYLGAKSVPTPTARSEQKPPRSTVDKVVAGTIDVGVGMIPGIGPAAAVYSAAAPLLGLPSVGDLALNLRDRNTFDVNTATRSAAANSGGNAEERLMGAQPAEPQKVADVAPAPVTSFASKYLGFTDTDVTPRPTPMEKWGGSGANDVPYRL